MAGLLDLFAIGFSAEGLSEFETNLKNTEKQLDNTEKKIAAMTKSLQELDKQGLKDSDTYKLIQKDLKNAKKEVEGFAKNIDTMKGQSEYKLLSLKKNFGNLTKTIGILARVGVTIKQSLGFYEQAAQIDLLAQKTGIAAEKLQRLGNAAKRYGGTMEGTAGTVKILESAGRDISKGGNGGGLKEIAKNAGISISQDPEQTLENIARKMETLKTEAEKLNLAKSIGIDDATTQLIIQGVALYREELKRADKYKLYTKEDIERMRDYRQIQSDIRMGVESVFGAIWRMLLPAITLVSKAVRGLLDWGVEHEGAVQIIAIFVSVTTGIMTLIAAVKLVNVAFSLLAANPVVLTIIAIAAGITALIVIIEDLIVWANDGNSVIKDLFESMGYDVDAMGKDLKRFFDGIVNWFNGAIEWANALGDKISDLGKKLKALWDSVPEPLKNFIKGGLNIATLGIPNAIIKETKQRLEIYKKNDMNAVSREAISNYNQTESINRNNNFNTDSLNETNIKNINSSSDSSKSVNIAKVEILTQASDGKDIARYLGAMTSFDNGMRA